jgi:hypothetical protein
MAVFAGQKGDESGEDRLTGTVNGRLHLNRPPFSSPFASAEMDGKTGEKVETWLTLDKTED